MPGPSPSQEALEHVLAAYEAARAGGSFAARLRADYDRYGKLIREAGIKLQ